jgi:hypothetical protein
MNALITTAALGLDWCFGEPRRWIRVPILKRTISCRRYAWSRGQFCCESR